MIKNNIKAFFIHIFMVVCAGIIVFFLMKKSVVINAKYNMTLIVSILYILDIIIYISFGKLLKPTKSKAADFFTGIMIFIVGFIIWLVAVISTGGGLADIAPINADKWGVYSIYNQTMIPFLRYVKNPIVLLVTNLAPSILFAVGIKLKRHKINKKNKKQSDNSKIINEK